MIKKCELNYKGSDCPLWVRSCEECSHYKDPFIKDTFKQDVIDILNDIINLIGQKEIPAMKITEMKKKLYNITKKLK
jgi:hypothetical protein